MVHTVKDIEKQTRQDGKSSKGTLKWVHGDGALFTAIGHIKKYLCPILDDTKSFYDHISTPEIWHTQATDLNSNADNHYGPSMT